MADWTSNAGMLWAGQVITDHNRAEINLSTEKIGSDKRMVDGTLRRHFIKNIRTWQTSWDSIPADVNANAIPIANGGISGRAMETFYLNTPGAFRLVLKNGNAIGLSTPNPAESALPYKDANFYIVNVMFTEFSVDIKKRGPYTDLWNVNVTLQEV